MEKRPAPEIVVIVFAIAAAVVLVVTTIGIIVIEVVDPSTDTSTAVDVVGGTFSALLAVAIGYALGIRHGGRQGPD